MQEYRLRPTAGKTEDQSSINIFSGPKPLCTPEVIKEERILVLHDFFGRDETKFYQDEMDKLPLLPIPKGLNYRSNIRCRVHSPELSQIVFERSLPFLKPILLQKDDYKQCGVGYKLHGLWVPVGIDVNWVVSKYPSGSHFGPHYDGPTVTDFGQRTLQSIVIYVNDSFEGGCTQFFDESKQALDPVQKDDMFYGEQENVILSVKPRAGSALIFNHHQLHAGQQTANGEKYIMRSDIIYQREDVEDVSPKEKEAINYLIAAQQAEVDKDLDQAMRCYKKAFNTWPELEFIGEEV